MEDCKYAQICRFYGTVKCYTDNNEESGCFRIKTGLENFIDSEELLRAEQENNSEFFGRRE